jgi:hypothetical protein
VRASCSNARTRTLAAARAGSGTPVLHSHSPTAPEPVAPYADPPPRRSRPVSAAQREPNSSRTICLRTARPPRVFSESHMMRLRFSPEIAAASLSSRLPLTGERIRRSGSRGLLGGAAGSAPALAPVEPPRDRVVCDVAQRALQLWVPASVWRRRGVTRGAPAAAAAASQGKRRAAPSFFWGDALGVEKLPQREGVHDLDRQCGSKTGQRQFKDSSKTVQRQRAVSGVCEARGSGEPRGR